MSQPITVHYTPSKQDYATVLRLFYWTRSGTKVSLVVLAIAFGLMVYLVASSGTTPTIFELIWLILPPLFVTFVFISQPARIARKAAENEQLIAEATWEVSDEGVRISSRFGSTNLDWGSLARMISTRDYYLLISRSNKNAFRFLPRRAFSSDQEQNNFLQIIEEKLSAS